MTLLEHALAYASKGWPVYPLDEGKKITTVPGGWKNATTRPDILMSFDWTTGIGMATGKPSGILILDVDPRHGGTNTLLELEKRYDPLPETIHHRTPRLGVHYWFQLPFEGLKSSNGLLPGLDILSDGFLVPVPPTTVNFEDNGKRVAGKYEFVTKKKVEIARIPAWLIHELDEADKRKRNIERVEGIPDVIPEGQRDTAVTKLVGGLRRYGLDESEILETLREFNKRLAPPFSERDLQAKARRSQQWTADAPIIEEIPKPKIYTIRELGEESRKEALRRGGHVLKCGEYLPSFSGKNDLGGLDGGQVTLFLGNSGAGKTDVVINWLYHERATAAWAQIDMGRTDMFRRFIQITHKCGRDVAERIESGEIEGFDQVLSEWQHLRLTSNARTIEQVIPLLREYQIVVVDTVQKLQGKGSEYEKFTDICMKIAEARDAGFDGHLILISQPHSYATRQASKDSKEGKIPPVLEDARGGSIWKENVDNGFVIFRQDPGDRELQVIAEKLRNGSPGAVQYLKHEWPSRRMGPRDWFPKEYE